VPVDDLGSVMGRTRRSGLPAGWQHGAFMEIFVRAYQDSNGDGMGDLPGLISRLDYLQDLGIRGLWLMPIHPSEDRDHGYAVTDYRAVHPDYGTLDDFDRLLREAHARGIGVIIDYVLNHSASRHPLFQRSRSSPGDAYRDWYVWNAPGAAPPAGWRIYEADPWRRDPSGTYFAAFSRRMPDFNWRKPAVEAWHHDNLRWWLDRGVDGFRFDAVGHLVENGPDAWDCQPENLPIMVRIRDLLDAYPNRFMVCEVPGDPQAYARAAGSAFGFDVNGMVVAAAGGDEPALARVAAYFETAPPSVSTLLSNHDSFAGRRVADQLRGDVGRLKLAAALLILLPGTPFLYYGEEIGLAGHRTLPADAALRTPMSWSGDAAQAGFTTGRAFRPLAPNAATHNVVSQRGAPASLQGTYRALLGLRNRRPSIARGDYEVLAIAGPVFAFRRRLGAECTIVIVNAARRAGRVPVRGRWPAANAPVLYGQGGDALAPLAPLEVRVLEATG